MISVPIIHCHVEHDASCGQNPFMSTLCLATVFTGHAFLFPSECTCKYMKQAVTYAEVFVLNILCTKCSFHNVYTQHSLHRMFVRNILCTEYSGTSISYWKNKYRNNPVLNISSNKLVISNIFI